MTDPSFAYSLYGFFSTYTTDIDGFKKEEKKRYLAVVSLHTQTDQ
jgi:hypothetical protein